MGIVTFQSFSAPQLPTNMKFLVLATCVAVSTAQGFFGLQAHPNGATTPIDEPAVAAARADHLATKFGAGGYVAGYGAGVGMLDMELDWDMQDMELVWDMLDMLLLLHL